MVQLFNEKIFFYFFIIFQFQNLVFAEDKIAYIDIDKLLNQSIAGKLITKKIENKYKEDLKFLKKLKLNFERRKRNIITKKYTIFR